jgi:[acyl-carrier-protein] S-malonyltransferase
MSEEKTAVVFPGQGAQYVGMGSSFFAADSEAREVLAQCYEGSGMDLEKLILEGPEELLAQTAVTQPAIFAVSMAIYRVLKSRTGLVPDFAAGFSLGQYSALAAAGAFDIKKGAELLKHRGSFMQDANGGAMAAVIGMEPESIKEVLNQVDGYVDIANYNSPGQTVISGTESAVGEAVEALLKKGAKKAVPLKVSGAFHSKLMEGAASRFKEVLAGETFGKTQFPVIGNETAREIEDVGFSLYTQLVSPVRWQDSIEYLRERGVTRIIEVGPGKVLSGLIRRIDRSLEVVSVEEIDDLEKLR